MRPYWLFSVLLLAVACQPSSPDPAVPVFASVPQASPLQPGLIDEVSGIADSRTMPGHLWAEEDGGNPARLTLLSHDGAVTGYVALPVANRDWEDLTIGPGPQAGVSYLYLADIGDNTAQNEVSYVYRFLEPKSLAEPVEPVERIAFRYPDGARDAETLFIDPLTNDLWVVSKRETSVHLYRLPYPQSTSQIQTAEAQGELPLSFVTSGGMSPDGHQILLKTYTSIYRWARTGSESIADALQKRPYQTLSYRLEPQGEAICFDRAGTGYFTLSERASTESVSLFYYARQ